MKTIATRTVTLCSILLLAACNQNKKDDPEQAGNDSTITVKTPVDTANVDTTDVAVFVPNEKRYFYGPKQSVINGKLSMEMFYGPPGYGENPEEDMKEDMLMLSLESPVKVFSNSPEEQENTFDVTKQDVRDVQLTSTHGIDLTPYVGKNIQITGVFFGSHTRHHHAEVLMDVEKVEVIK